MPEPLIFLYKEGTAAVLAAPPLATTGRGTTRTCTRAIRTTRIVVSRVSRAGQPNHSTIGSAAGSARAIRPAGRASRSNGGQDLAKETTRLVIGSCGEE